MANIENLEKLREELGISPTEYEDWPQAIKVLEDGTVYEKIPYEIGWYKIYPTWSPKEVETELYLKSLTY